MKNILKHTNAKLNRNMTTNNLDNLNYLNYLNNLNKDIKIQFTSDNHLEFHKGINILDFVTPCAPNLAILGDLGYPQLDNFKDFISQASQNYIKVFFFPGNHEYYQRKNDQSPTPLLSMEEIDDLMIEICNCFDNVYYLNNEEHLLTENVVILGTTLWTDIPESHQYKMKQSMNDYNYIFVKEQHYKTGITPKQTTELHKNNVQWLKNKLEEHKDKQIIIMTHHMPSFQMIHEKYKGSDINYGFASNLDYLMEQNDNIKFWLCGHTHFNVQTKINNCECIANPYGYPGENKQYDKKKFIDILDI